MTDPSMTLTPSPNRRVSDGVDSLWYVAGGPQAFIVLAALLAVTVALAAVFPQLPAGLDPAATERWLSDTAARYGGAGEFLRGIGAFDLLNTLWTLVLLAAVAFHLALRIARQIAHLLHRRGERVPAPPPGLAYEAVLSPLALPEAVLEAERVLKPGLTTGDKVSTLPDRSTEVAQDEAPFTATLLNEQTPPLQQEQGVRLYAERRGWGAAGPLLTYAGGFAILLGLLVNGIAGWRAGNIVLAAGESAAVHPVQGLNVTMTAAGEGAAQLTLANGEAHTVFVSTNAPGRWGSLWAVQRATGPALTIEARAVDTTPLPLQSLDGNGGAQQVLRLRFQGAEGEQAFVIPTRNLVLRVVSYPALPDRSINRPVFFVEGYRADETTPTLSEFVEDAGEFRWENVVLTLRRDRYFVLDLASLPGLPLLAAGGLLALLGAVLLLWFGPVRTWTDLTTLREHTVVAVRAAGPGVPQVLAASAVAGLTTVVPVTAESTAVEATPDVGQLPEQPIETTGPGEDESTARESARDA